MFVNLCDKKGFCCYYEFVRKYNRELHFTWKKEIYYVDRWDGKKKFYHIQWNKHFLRFWSLRKYISKDILMYSILNIKIINSPDRTLKGGVL